MKFKPEDFQSINTRTSQILADLENKRLTEMLADAPTVYGFGLESYQPWSPILISPVYKDATHTARLVDIRLIANEKIGKE